MVSFGVASQDGDKPVTAQKRELGEDEPYATSDQKILYDTPYLDKDNNENNYDNTSEQILANPRLE